MLCCLCVIVFASMISYRKLLFDWLVDYYYIVRCSDFRCSCRGIGPASDWRPKLKCFFAKMKCRWRRHLLRQRGRPIFGAAPAVTPDSLSCESSSSNRLPQRLGQLRERRVCSPICWINKSSRKLADSSVCNAAQRATTSTAVAAAVAAAANSNCCDIQRRSVILSFYYAVFSFFRLRVDVIHIHWEGPDYYQFRSVWQKKRRRHLPREKKAKYNGRTHRLYKSEAIKSHEN